jgi:hypothetical protein
MQNPVITIKAEWSRVGSTTTRVLAVNDYFIYIVMGVLSPHVVFFFFTAHSS